MQVIYPSTSTELAFGFSEVLERYEREPRAEDENQPLSYRAGTT